MSVETGVAKNKVVNLKHISSNPNEWNFKSDFDCFCLIEFIIQQI